MSWFALGACTNNPPPSARAPAPTVAAPLAVAVDAPAVAMDAGAPARCVAPTWRGRAQHVAVDEGGEFGADESGALVGRQGSHVVTTAGHPAPLWGRGAAGASVA